MTDSIVFAFLLLGHVVGDFVLQSRAMAEGKRTSTEALVKHIALVAAAHLVFVLPVLHAAGVFILVGVVASHLVIDFAKGWCERKFGIALRWFLTDQALHLAALGVATAMWSTDGAYATRFFPALGIVLHPDTAPLAGLAAVFVFNARGGAAIVGLLLHGLRLDQPSETGNPHNIRLGATIGILERWIAIVLVVAGAWGGLGLVLGAKSLARFKELDDQHFAEYYLIGTLSSMLVAVATTTFVMRTCGAAGLG